jgi:hypothetical protein
VKRRAYQLAALVGLRKHRSFFLLWRRQGGKSTTLAAAALDEMTAVPGRLVTYASASLLLGREIVLKESEVLQRTLSEFRKEAADLRLETADTQSRKALPANLSADDFADLFESQRLEFRLWHDQTTFSRTQVIAPNPATARGWSGTVMLDEFGFIRDFRDLWEAVEPIISSNADFKFIGATTPPKDDSHYSYELTAPVLGTEFPASAAGNWYNSEAGELVHRVDIHDAYAAGQKLYDRRTGRELSPEEHYARAEDKDAWRRNYKVQHVLGGTSAVGLLTLETAQQRGVGHCRHFAIETDEDMTAAMVWIRDKLGDGPVGLGLDLATTTGETSNPTSISVIEKRGVEKVVTAILTWKTADPAVATERIRRTLQVVPLRPAGGPARRLSIDATNERYFAAAIRASLQSIIPVELIVGSEAVERPGQEPMNWKQFLGSQWVGELEDNHVWLPPERYVKEDFRLVKKDRGSFTCDPDEYGRHGDTFDSCKLADHSLELKGVGRIVVPTNSRRARVLAAKKDRRLS